MTLIPTLRTDRLVLDGFRLEDAEEVERLVGEEQIARFTLNIPHPYPAGAAATWIAEHKKDLRRGQGLAFAVRLPDRRIVGCVGLRIERRHDRGELGYWIGLPFWGQGYATEAARACLVFGFEHFALHKIVASHMTSNPASGRVMEKLGMTREAERLQHTRKDGVYHDQTDYGLLRASFEPRAARPEVSRRSAPPPSGRARRALRGR